MRILSVGLEARASRAHVTECQILRAGRPRSQERIFITAFMNPGFTTPDENLDGIGG